MAQTFLVFDFGANEEAAQSAWHRLEAWRQAFRLGNKIQCKFERGSPEGKDGSEKHEQDTVSQPAGQTGTPIRLLVKLDFSNHEKHLFHRWLDRIPAEEPFKFSKGQVVRHHEDSFQEILDLYNSLN